MTLAPNHRTDRRVGNAIRGKYQVLELIATGTMANVYAATHRNGSQVALKILHSALARDPRICERFRREGYFANAVGHPGIVRAIDDDVTEDGCPFLVMELLRGETLEERRCRMGGRLVVAEVLAIGDALLDVLSAAHARDVLHRDLKPENVFLTHEGEVKVLDFGVARWNDGQDSSEMTAVGMVLGTPGFMPPEQALGRRGQVDAQSDLWALGATLFMLLTGESVHGATTTNAKLVATIRTPARPLGDVAPWVPRPLCSVIDRALAFDKGTRWPDAPSMRQALHWAWQTIDAGAPPSMPGSAPVSLPADDAQAGSIEFRFSVPDDDGVITSAPPLTPPRGGDTDAAGSNAGGLEDEVTATTARDWTFPHAGTSDEDRDDRTERRRRTSSIAPPPGPELRPASVQVQGSTRPLVLNVGPDEQPAGAPLNVTAELSRSTPPNPRVSIPPNVGTASPPHAVPSTPGRAYATRASLPPTQPGDSPEGRGPKGDFSGRAANVKGGGPGLATTPPAPTSTPTQSWAPPSPAPYLAPHVAPQAAVPTSQHSAPPPSPSPPPAPSSADAVQELRSQVSARPARGPLVSEVTRNEPRRGRRLGTALVVGVVLGAVGYVAYLRYHAHHARRALAPYEAGPTAQPAPPITRVQAESPASAAQSAPAAPTPTPTPTASLADATTAPLVSGTPSVSAPPPTTASAPAHPRPPWTRPLRKPKPARPASSAGGEPTEPSELAPFPSDDP